jgi:glycosyltransferase involved in cell wall biosynthesis
VQELGAGSWVRFAGRVSDEELVDLYRRAWIVTSASISEGWGMTLTEAAACGTPALATDIAGHRDAVRSGSTGLLAGDDDEFARHLRDLCKDDGLRERLSVGALAYAATLTWDATAHRTLAVLADDARRRRRRR